jgi:hypothetical protein
MYSNLNSDQLNKSQESVSSQDSITTSTTNTTPPTQYGYQNESFHPYQYYNFPQSYYSHYNQTGLIAGTGAPTSVYTQYNNNNNNNHQQHHNQVYNGYFNTNQQLTSPISQAASPNLLLQQQHHNNNNNIVNNTTNMLVSTPINTNFKMNYLYPTPPPLSLSSSSSSTSNNISDSLINSTTSSNSNSPTAIIKTKVSQLENDNENDAPKLKEKNGKVVRRRNRVQFSQQQIETMEAIFDKSHYPEVHLIDKLSDRLGISIERLSIWFQNRRAKFKKSKRPANSELKQQQNSNPDTRARDIDSILSNYTNSLGKSQETTQDQNSS